jgi:hypothetical protein
MFKINIKFSMRWWSYGFRWEMSNFENRSQPSIYYLGQVSGVWARLTSGAETVFNPSV